MTLNQILPLAITMGEPAGIGWEITLKAWEKRAENDQPFYLLDDFNRLKKVCNNVPIEIIKTPSDALQVFPNALPIFHMFQRSGARLDCSAEHFSERQVVNFLEVRHAALSRKYAFLVLFVNLGFFHKIICFIKQIYDFLRK